MRSSNDAPNLSQTVVAQPAEVSEEERLLAALMAPRSDQTSTLEALARDYVEDRQAAGLSPRSIGSDIRPRLERFLHHAHMVLTEGGSLRLAEATAGKGVKPLA